MYCSSRVNRIITNIWCNISTSNRTWWWHDLGHSQLLSLSQNGHVPGRWPLFTPSMPGTSCIATICDMYSIKQYPIWRCDMTWRTLFTVIWRVFCMVQDCVIFCQSSVYCRRIHLSPLSLMCQQRQCFMTRSTHHPPIVLHGDGSKPYRPSEHQNSW